MCAACCGASARRRTSSPLHAESGSARARCRSPSAAGTSRACTGRSCCCRCQLRWWCSMMYEVTLRSAGTVKLRTVRGSGKDWKPNSLQKRWRLRAVALERLAAVPHFPEVRVAAASGCCIAPVAARRVRAAGPVRALGVVPADDFGQELVEEFSVVAPAHAGPLQRPLLADEPLLQLVVPAPEGEAGVVAQAADLVFRLGADAAQECAGRRPDRSSRRT